MAAADNPRCRRQTLITLAVMTWPSQDIRGHGRSWPRLLYRDIRRRHGRSRPQSLLRNIRRHRRSKIAALCRRFRRHCRHSWRRPREDRRIVHCGRKLFRPSRTMVSSETVSSSYYHHHQQYHPLQQRSHHHHHHHHHHHLLYHRRGIFRSGFGSCSPKRRPLSAG